MIRFLRFFVFLVAKSLYAMDDGTPQEPPYSGRVVPLCVIDGVLNQGSVPEAPQLPLHGNGYLSVCVMEDGTSQEPPSGRAVPLCVIDGGLHQGSVPEALQLPPYEYVDLAVRILKKRFDFYRELKRDESSAEGADFYMRKFICLGLFLNDKSMDVFDKIEHLHLNLRAFLATEATCLDRAFVGINFIRQYIDENGFLKEGLCTFFKKTELSLYLKASGIQDLVDLYEGSFRFLRDSYKEDMKLIKVKMVLSAAEEAYSPELNFRDGVKKIMNLELIFSELFYRLSQDEKKRFYALYLTEMAQAEENAFSKEVKESIKGTLQLVKAKPYLSHIFTGHTISMHEHILLLQRLIENVRAILDDEKTDSSHKTGAGAGAGVGAGSED